MGNGRRFLCIVSWLLGSMTSGCLDFGSDSEFLEPNVTAQHLQQVTSLTGISFPAGSTGLAFLFEGSGIDDALAIKVAIASDQREAFLLNEVFAKGEKSAPNIQIGKAKKWWKLGALAERIDRTLGLPNARFVECTLGSEDGKLVVYISWVST